jgi:hypothetical protein
MSGRRGLRAGVAGLVALSAMATARVADAYCRTSACGEDVGARCTPELGTDCGIPLFWPTSCAGYSLQRDASARVDLATVTDVVANAFATWQAADCGGGAHPSIQAVDLGPVDCAAQGYDADEKNANVIVFRDAGWPYSQGALALTTVTFSLDTGEIRDADIELNSAAAMFTTGDDAVLVDLPSILTHETGHFLGLAHSPVAEATMQTEYPPQSTFLRTLEADDVAGICAVYPPEDVRACDATPANGLGQTCGEPADSTDGTGCGISPKAFHQSAWWASLAAGVLLVGLGALRKHPRATFRGR